MTLFPEIFFSSREMPKNSPILVSVELAPESDFPEFVKSLPFGYLFIFFLYRFAFRKVINVCQYVNFIFPTLYNAIRSKVLKKYVHNKQLLENKVSVLTSVFGDRRYRNSSFNYL